MDLYHFIYKLIFEILDFEESCNLIGQKQLRSKIHILPNLRIAIGSRELQELSFQTIFRKIK